MKVERIISGGQTGVDRAALDVALALGLEIGGWVPLGRRAEDGRIPDRYTGLVECDSRDYRVRTERNVRDSDATLILARGAASGGTALTERMAESYGKPHLVVDLTAGSIDGDASEAEVARVRAWLDRVGPRILNVAGPRASQAPDIEVGAANLLRRVLDEGE